MKKLIPFLLLIIASSSSFSQDDAPIRYKGLKLSSVIKYDQNGNIIYMKNGDFYGPTTFTYNSKNQRLKMETKKIKMAAIYKYHSNGKKAYIKKIEGGKVTQQIWYDEYGFGIKSIDRKGKVVKTKNEYDEEGRLIHRVRDNGEEEWREYNSTGYKRHVIEEDCEFWEEYDSHDKVIYEKKIEKDGTPNETKWLYEYDEHDNVIHFICYNNGYEWWEEYNENNQVVYGKKTPSSYDQQYAVDGYIEYWNEFNEAGKCIHTRYKDGHEVLYEYDDKGSLIYYKNRDGEISRFVYQYYSNGSVKEKWEYK